MHQYLEDERVTRIWLWLSAFAQPMTEASEPSTEEDASSPQSERGDLCGMSE